MTKMDTTNTKIIFIITFAWLIYINSVYCSYAESVNILRTPLNTIEPQRWHSASDEIAKNGRKLRTEDHVFSDRARLKELLDKGPHTAKELAELTGRPVYTVRYDIRYTPELRNHRNLIERERRLEEKIASDRRARFKELLEQGPHTAKELAELTGRPLSTVWSDIRYTPELKNHRNLVIREPKSEEKIASDRRARFKELLEQGPHTAKELAELTGRPLSTVWSDIRYTPELKNHRNLVIRKERPKKEITSDRARLKELLDQGPHTVKELAELTGRPVYTVRYDLAGTPELRNHSNLVLVTRKQREEWIASDRARLKELLEQGPHTVKELAELTGRPVSTVRNDIDGTIELKNHRNLIERERRPKKEITSDRARLKKLLDQGQHTIKELAELTGIPLSTVRYDLAGTPELKNHRNLLYGISMFYSFFPLPLGRGLG